MRLRRRKGPRKAPCETPTELLDGVAGRRRKGPGKAPCETPTELLDGVAGPAKLDLPDPGLTSRSSEVEDRDLLRARER
jgi:hypothetical protein